MDNPGLLEIELYNKDDILLKTSCFISGPLKTAIYRAAGIFSNDAGGWLIPVRMYKDFKRTIQPLNVNIRDLPEFLVAALAEKVPKRC